MIGFSYALDQITYITSEQPHPCLDALKQRDNSYYQEAAEVVSVTMVCKLYVGCDHGSTCVHV